MSNPYVSRGPVRDPAMFFGRENELREIAAFLRGNQSVSIVGPRKIGKTSLLFHLMRPPTFTSLGLDENFLFVYLDCEVLGDGSHEEIFGQFAVEIAEAHGLDSHGWVARREPDLFGLARRYNREQAAHQALKNMDSYLGQIVYTISRVNASDRYTPEEREQTISRLAEELQAEVDKFKYDTAANMDYVDEVRRKVGRELVWLDVHKDPDIFTRETRLSLSKDAVSHLWNHTTRQFRAWERAPQPPKHFQGMLPTEFTPEQYAEARKRVRTYNRTIARAMQADDEKALVSAIQELEGWSGTYTDPQERRVMAQAVWHAAHETERPGATASAAFHAFRSEMLAQLRVPRPRPTSEVIILGAQHRSNLGQRAMEYDQPRTLRLQVLLEDYTDTYGHGERRLAAYELDQDNQPFQRIGYLPKDAPRQTGRYLATLHRPEGKRRIEGQLIPLRNHDGP